MSDEVVAGAAPEPVADAPAPESESLSDHQAAFGPPDPTLDGEAKAKNDEVRAKARHRAASQQATPDDVAEINKWTAREKAALDKAGVERLPNESERVYRARARAELAERHSKPVPQAPAAAAAPPAVHAATTARPVPGETGQPLPPTRVKPSMEEIGDGLKYADFEAYNEDLVEWKVEQREAARDAKAAESKQKADNDASFQEYQAVMKKAAERVAKFKETHDDFDDLMAQHQGLDLPPSVFKAIAVHDNGPDFLYYLLTHPDELTGVLMMFDGKPPTDAYVAHATRWLSSRTQAAPTGSAAPAPPIALAPRPPNPVRTGHTRTSDEIPDDDSPLSAHERKWGGARR
jgi:hypothetical protein